MPKFKINLEDVVNISTADKKRVRKITELVLTKEKITHAELNIVLVDDEFIINLNKQYLNKETTTDVISFHFEEPPDLTNLEGEVYANIHQIKRQAEEYDVEFVSELQRIIIHGVLHLMGYEDSTPAEKKVMTEKEDYYLSLLN